MSFSASFVKHGLLAAVAPSYAQNGELAATLARGVLAGKSPRELAATVAMDGVLHLNAATAQRIGIVLTPDVLASPTVVLGPN